jgi:S-adenosyl methyltransferase
VTSSQDEHPTFDTGVAHIARVYDYWLGGKNNYAADREAGDQAIQAYPDLALSVRANRAFLARTVRYLAGEGGIRQFLDIGTGIAAAARSTLGIAAKPAMSGNQMGHQQAQHGITTRRAPGIALDSAPPGLRHSAAGSLGMSAR